MTEPVQGETYRGEDWYGEELVNRKYLMCVFDNIDLTEAGTRGCEFIECSFSGIRFNASRHTDSAFLRCTFTRCNLFEAEFTFDLRTVPMPEAIITPDQAVILVQAAGLVVS
jgi:uncharacterized protein YjbI with pentapeptide repeats